MKVRVKEPYQVNVDGELHFAGDVVEVEDEQAAKWVAAGYVEAVTKAKPKK